MNVNNSSHSKTPVEERMSRDEFLMEAAVLVAKRSTCLRLHVGAVVAIDGRILSTGYNGAPSGMPHCAPPFCGPSEPCTRAVHAEANCIAFAAKHGIALSGGIMYSTDSPCVECAKLIINAGLRGVTYFREYRDRSPIVLMRDAGIYTDLYEIIQP